MVSSRLRVVMTNRERTWLEFKIKRDKFTVEIAYVAMQVLCKPEGRLTERFFSSNIIRTIIILLYFFIMQNLRFRKNACMHFNCNNELEVSHIISQALLFLLGILTNFKRGLDLLYWKEFNNTLFSIHKKKKKWGKIKISHCIDW